VDADEPGPVRSAPEEPAVPAEPEVSEAEAPGTPEAPGKPEAPAGSEAPADPEPPSNPPPLETPAVAVPAASELVELTLASVELSPEGLHPATGTVSLVDLAAGGHLDIVMARADAVLVQEALSGTLAPRPRAHDLLLAAVAALSGAVTGVTLVERRPGGVYVASVRVLRPDGSVAELDARPSDALNVALRSPGAALRADRALIEVPPN